MGLLVLFQVVPQSGGSSCTHGACIIHVCGGPMRPTGIQRAHTPIIHYHSMFIQESVSHCKLNYDDAADEFEEFYDYTIETEEDEESDDVMEEEATDRQLTVPSDEGKLNGN